MGVDHGIHGGGEDGDGEGEVSHGKIDIYLFRVDGSISWDKRYLVKTVAPPHLFELRGSHDLSLLGQVSDCKRDYIRGGGSKSMVAKVEKVDEGGVDII